MNTHQYQPRSLSTSMASTNSPTNNQTYHGLIMNLQDALLILEGIRLGVLPKVQRRLNDFERKCIVAGSIYAWNENELGMKRWTDGKSWLASKVKGPFLIYQEHDGTRNVKANGLVKQSFSLTTKQNEKFHLIAYYDPAERSKGVPSGKIPSQDANLLKLQLDPSVYLTDFLHYGAGASSLLPPQSYVQQTQMSYPTSTPGSANNMNSQSMMSYNGLMYSAPPQQQPAYYCHPSMMSYQYVSNNAMQASSPTYSYPQHQQVYMQLMPTHGPQYAYGLPTMSSMEQEYGQKGSVSSVISGLPTPALSSANSCFSFSSAPTPTTASAQYTSVSPINTNPKSSLESPTFSYSKNTPNSPQSIPSPSLHRSALGYPPAKLENNSAMAGPLYGVSQGNAQVCSSQTQQDARTLKSLGKAFYV